MSGSFHIGDAVTQYGDHNTGIVKNQAPTDPASALQALVAAARLLHDEVPAEDQQAIDDALQTLEAGPDAPPGTLRRALSNIAGIATMVGRVGVPVIEAVKGVRAALGI
ncbi:hypothetical protein AB0N17_38820 [Streptomyces sp. NPDC051133]|uniref:hypothetical protein n=1 Tax=Streptomyces sp. NPDC051133 TaxID=3155521 RepID=UPI00343E432F